MIVTRFAPSPTGFLHLGHVYSLICSYEYSKNHNGKFILRIEDIDFTRCKNIYTEAIIKDINWLKIPFFRTKNQSIRRKQYSKALNYLKSRELIFFLASLDWFNIEKFSILKKIKKNSNFL